MVKMADLPAHRYVIEDDIPVPKNNGPKCHNPELYATVRKLKIGQSILIEKQRSGMTSNLARSCKVKLTQKVEGDKMRIWRVA